MRIVARLDDYIVEQGWSAELAHDLVRVSREPAILRYTPGDAQRRFADVPAAEAWHSNPEKQPVVYTLRDAAQHQLCGFIWLRRGQHKAIDGSYQTTFGIRLYDGARGKGLSYPFAKAAHDDYAALPIHDTPPRMWLETYRDNLPALKLYQKLGYQILTSTGEQVVMGRQTATEG